MLILRAGLYLAVVVAAWTVWASLGAGYHVETAIVRGLLAFLPVVFVAYLAEIVVVTAPVPHREAGKRGAAYEDETVRVEDDAHTEQENRTPASLPAARERATAMERRAAA